jgi:hypothetical protein
MAAASTGATRHLPVRLPDPTAPVPKLRRPEFLKLLSLSRKLRRMAAGLRQFLAWTDSKP